MRNHPLNPALIIALCLCLPAANAYAQTKNSKPATAKPQSAQPAALSPATKPLTTLEQELFDEINLARKNPTAYVTFLEQYRTYYQDKTVRFPDGRLLATNEGVAALDEAIAFMRALKPAGPLEIRRGMMLGAKLHLDDMKKSGRFGHIGSNGSKPEDRLNLFGSWQESVAENLVYDSRSARNNVIGMIIDDGVATRGHRRNIFKTDFRVIGIAVDPPAKERTMCVITFAGGFIDKVDGKTPAAVKY